MNKDFHYYGTYTAARIAGYNKDDALKIAYSAQFVDDCDENRIVAGEINTVQSGTKLASYAINPQNWKNSELNEIRQAWMPFHFLPGNIDEIYKYEGYGKDNDDNSELFPLGWSYDDNEKNLFKLMCVSNSETVEKMINEMINPEENNYLELIGLRMHVLADTWAHQYFVGAPCWAVNDTSTAVEEIDGIGNHIKYLTCFPYTPKGFRYSSMSYMGHGRMGHLPDEGYRQYKFNPQWCGDKKLEKYNPFEFLFAFVQMVYALTCIRNNNSFEKGNYTKLDYNTIITLLKIFETKDKDQTEAWRKNLLFLTGDSELIDDYKKEDVKHEGGVINYLKFQNAARKQLDFLTEYLASKNVPFLLP